MDGKRPGETPRMQSWRSTPARCAALAALALAGQAHARPAAKPPQPLTQIRAELHRQAGLIAAQQQEIDKLKLERDRMLEAIRAGATPPEARPAPAILT